MISVVMAYYNRRSLLLNTLYSISLSKYTGDIETIIVDDASTDGASLSDLPVLFPKLNIKVYTVDKDKKWWINPCIPFNIGFSLASGDKIILQNPECLHTGDILSVVANQKDNEYLTFGAYSVGPAITNAISSLTTDNDFMNNVLRLVEPTVDMRVDLAAGHEKWYQHSIYNPGAIHFCCSIDRGGLNSLGGFDERFAYGIAYDDREFIVRVRRMGLHVSYIDKPFVIHQCHGYTNYSNQDLVKKNSNLLDEVVASAHVMAPNKLSYNLKDTVLI